MTVTELLNALDAECSPLLLAHVALPVVLVLHVKPREDCENEAHGAQAQGRSLSFAVWEG